MEFKSISTVILALFLVVANANPLVKVRETPRRSGGLPVRGLQGLAEVSVTDNADGSGVLPTGMTELPDDITGMPVPISQDPCNTFPSRPIVNYDQRAVLFDGKDEQGNEFVIPSTNAPDMSQYNFDNQAMSICVTGIWLFYVENNYNAEPNSGMEYVFGPDNFCTNLKYVPGYVRSARFVGSPADYRSDTMTLFKDLYFQGDTEYMFRDEASLSLEDGHKSLIITGEAPWTVYSESQFEGKGVCLFPPKSNDTSPYFLVDLSAVVPYESIKSARKGCWEKNICDGSKGHILM